MPAFFDDFGRCCNFETPLLTRFQHGFIPRADVGYHELVERLKPHGMKETEAGIANKISRGRFSATFLLASLKAVDADVVRLESI
jgi:hypothetical protein